MFRCLLGLPAAEGGQNCMHAIACMRHKSDSATFRELSGPDQARSISGTIHQLEQAIRARARESADPDRIIESSPGQVERLLGRLRHKA
jgi:hypothetical protein